MISSQKNINPQNHYLCQSLSRHKKFDMNEQFIHIQQYYQKIKSANKELTKKEAFKDLLNRLYLGNDEIQAIIDKITLGAEATVLNIPR